MTLFPGKDESPRTKAIGRPQAHAIKVASPDTYRDLSVTEMTSGSPLKINSNA
jgi:hypothetical protein